MTTPEPSRPGTVSSSMHAAGSPAAVSALRTALFVPASRPERIPKAQASGADAIIVDLEDAVAPAAKPAARDALAAFLDAHPDARLWVRINDAATPWHEDDLRACRGRAGIGAIMLPKAEDLSQVRYAADTGLPVIPIVESARGLAALAGIAVVSGIGRLAFGSLDYGLDMRLAADTPAANVVLDHARCQILLHSRIAGLPAPLDGVFPAIQDDTGLTRAARQARDMGFSGMLCIHPAQVPVIHAAFAPSADQIEWARRVLQAHQDNGAGAFQIDGKMVDAPVIGLALRILASIGEAAP